MTRSARRKASTIGASIAIGLFFNCHANAIDLTGRWASDVEVCDKLFMNKSGTMSFRPNSDLHGSGFIIQRGNIKGRTARCKINKTQTSDSVIHMVASCATDIMFSSVQFSVRVVDDDRINRVFPGFSELEMPYFRCPSLTEHRAPTSR
jgi:hypothetical protein